VTAVALLVLGLIELIGRRCRGLDKATVRKVADATVRSLVTRIADALTHPSNRPTACGNGHTPPASGVAAPDQL